MTVATAAEPCLPLRAGVANFITRSDFRGIELAGTFKGIDDSEDDGDWDAGIIAGLGGQQAPSANVTLTPYGKTLTLQEITFHDQNRRGRLKALALESAVAVRRGTIVLKEN